MKKWLSIFKVIMQTEANIIPLFVHNEKSGNIAGIILASEAAVESILEGVSNANANPTSGTPSVGQ